MVNVGQYDLLYLGEDSRYARKLSRAILIGDTKNISTCEHVGCDRCRIKNILGEKCIYISNEKLLKKIFDGVFNTPKRVIVEKITNSWYSDSYRIKTGDEKEVAIVSQLYIGKNFTEWAKEGGVTIDIRESQE